jgi:RluA family pseudouridine synthase
MNIIYKRFGLERFEAAYEVNEPQSGMRLDQFVQIYLASFSREQVKQKIKAGDVKIRNRPGNHRPNTKVYEKEIVEIVINKTIHEEEWWHGEKLELDTNAPIVYEDEDIYVIDKPPYMSTHPTGKHLFNCATVFLEQLTGGKTVHSIHRLDRETSGLLMLGKNPEASSVVGMHFENELVKKCYFFISRHQDEYAVGESFHAKENLDTGNKGDRRVYIEHHPEGSDIGKRAITEFKIIKKFESYTLGLAFPQTGRQHQIRVHAMAHGLPLIGDKLFLGSYEMFQRFKDLKASEEDYHFMEHHRHALHAIGLNLPWEEGRKTFIGQIPSDLAQWLGEKLNIDVKKLQVLLKEEIEHYFSSVERKLKTP